MQRIWKMALLSLLLCMGMNVQAVRAQSRNRVDKSTDVLMFATPAAGFLTTLLLKDYEGTKQLFLGAATSVATSYLLKYTVRKQRPDGSDSHAFPSNHTGVAFQGATFIMQRYGWKYALPAYAVSAYVAWGRVYAKRHDAWDVLAGAAIGVGSAYLFTRPFARKHQLTLSPVLLEGQRPGIYASWRF